MKGVIFMNENTQEIRITNQQRWLVITLILITFVIGTSEFVIMGLLTEISNNLNIPVSKAGLLVSLFAIAFASGTPILTAIVSPFEKHKVMFSLILIFILGNILSAIAATYIVLLVSRILTAIVSGVLTALCMSVASETMPRYKQPAIIAGIFAGFTIASVIGVPLGTFIGQLSSWRLTFWSTVLLSTIVFMMSIFVLPRDLKGNKTSFIEQLALFTHPKIILAFMITVLSFAGTYVIYTYITPIIENGLSISSIYVSIILFVYGLFSIVSNYLSGKIADGNGVGTLRYVLLAQAIILTSLYVTIHSTFSGLISLMLIALTMFAVNATIQLYLMNYAGKHLPKLKDFASSLTPIAINIGIAVGSSLGSYVVRETNLTHLSWVGGLGAIFAALLTFYIYGKDKKKSQP